MYDTVVVGAGLSGLTAASLLAKRGNRVAVIDKNYTPGGTCGVFKRQDTTFDQGSALLFGFGEQGFNSHRFVFNLLEEPISVIRHKSMYCMNFEGHRIEFYQDLDRFISQLSDIFPDEAENFTRFYSDLWTMYHDIMTEKPMFTTADEIDFKSMLPQIRKHPRSYLKFLRCMNMSAEAFLKKYFSNPKVIQFYDKLTMTYCYTTAKESPAILAAVMFIENHVGGSYYPAGSTLYLPGKLEKVIEENGGDMLLEQEVTSILIQNNRACGVELANGETILAEHVIYSGNVWQLYETLLNEQLVTSKERQWINSLVPTDSSAALYAKVRKEVIPEDTLPAEMVVGDTARLDENELTVYINSIDDKTLCDEGCHTVVAIGTSFQDWFNVSKQEYRQQKNDLREHIVDILETRFPGFREAVEYAEVGTPATMSKYASKHKGAGAGPKQMIGQHMLKRLHTQHRIKNLYCCGESTVMGTGTPTVTISGLAAANAVLRKRGEKPYEWTGEEENYVTVVKPPFTRSDHVQMHEPAFDLVEQASQCQFCEKPTCKGEGSLDVRGIMRRISVGNIEGARKLLNKASADNLESMEQRCIRATWDTPVQIREILIKLL